MPAPRPQSTIKYLQRPCVINRHTFPHVSFVGQHVPQVAWTHNGCLCNEVVALQYRHQVATPPVTRDIDCSFFDKLLKDNPVQLEPMTRWQVIGTYHGPWRQKYIKAKEKLDLFGWSDNYARVNMFTKDDLELNPPLKAPRAIQYRDPCFMLMHGRFVKPIEKWFYSLRDEYNTRIVGKADGYTIANDLLMKSEMFPDPVYLLLDASKFDSCVDVKWLRYTHRCYEKLYAPAYRRRLRHLSSLTIHNKGRSPRGLRYKTFGTRMSGDMDTGLGNSLIMWTMLSMFLKHVGVKGSIYVNGDDSVIVINRSDLGKTRDMTFFKECGFNMKYEVATSMNELEFCQARLIETDYGYTMARNPARVIGKAGWSTLGLAKRNKIRDYVHTIGMCERAASWGVPIASAMATAFIKATPCGRKRVITPWLQNHYESMQKWWKVGEPKISLQTRLNFEDAWGVTVAEQLRLERSIKVRLRGDLSAIQRNQLDILTEFTFFQ